MTCGAAFDSEFGLLWGRDMNLSGLIWQRTANRQSRSSTTDPDFLAAKVDAYYEERVKGTWAGQHPLKGRTPGPNAIRLRTNDYLCLAGHPRVIDAEVQALRQHGHGDSVSRVWLHHTRDTIRSFEERAAALLQAEDAVLCSSGYTANVGLIQTMASPGTPVYLDQKAHISLWEGVVSARARAIPFRHNDMDHLARQLREHGPGLVGVDALYSTDGKFCPLHDLVTTVEQFGGALIVDETHSFGAQGPNGAGLVVEHGLAHRVHFRTIGLSKAVASRGGIIASSRRNAEFFRYESLPAIFSTSVLPHEAAGYCAVLDVFASEDWRRQRLHDNHRALKHGLDQLGYNVDSSDAQIIALEAGDIVQTVALRDALESRGIFGAIFFPPATPDKRCLIRLTVNCNLSSEERDQVLLVCADIRDEVGMPTWKSTLRKARKAIRSKAKSNAIAASAI